MYDELVQKLRSVKDIWQTEEEQWMLDAADAIESLEEDRPRWISVNERLPEDETPVLVWGGRSIYTAVYGNRGGYSNNWWKLNGKPSHYCNPKFWMPLPEPPKEVDDGNK